MNSFEKVYGNSASSPSTSVMSPIQKNVRESRHVYVTGLPDDYDNERIQSVFTMYGRVQKVVRIDDGVVISFMDVRSAQKAQTGAGDHRLEQRIGFNIVFYEPGTSANGHSMPSSSSGQHSPRLTDLIKRRSPSPKNKDVFRSNSARNPGNSSTPVTLKKVSRLQQRVDEPLGDQRDDHLTGFVVENLPARSDSTVKSAIRDLVTCRKWGYLNDVYFEGSGDARKAFLHFKGNDVDIAKCIIDCSHANVLGSRITARLAKPLEICEFGGRMNREKSYSGTDDLPARYAIGNTTTQHVDVYHPKASRTLYVAGLETRISDETLRRRFSRYGSILDVDVKNYESPQPFAFIQFADINSSVKAINDAPAFAAQKKGKASRRTQDGGIKRSPFFGRSMINTKLWIGELPAEISSSYLDQKLKTLDCLIETIYDPRIRQAIVIFSNTEAATAAKSRIQSGTPKSFFFKSSDDSEHRLAVDYCSDRLHEFFVDRLHSSRVSLLPLSSAVDLPISVFIPSAVDPNTSTGVIDPPPDPSGNMPYRHDYHRDSSRRSPSYSRRRDRSRSRGRSRDRSSERSRDRSRERSRESRRRDKYYEKIYQKKGRREPQKSNSSSDSSSSSDDSSRRHSPDSRSSSSPHAYKKSRARTSERDRNRDRDRNHGKSRPSSGRRSSPFGTPKHSSSATDRKTNTSTRSSPPPPPPPDPPRVPPLHPMIEPPPDDRKSGDSGFCEEIPRPPLDPPPAPPPLKTLPTYDTVLAPSPPREPPPLPPPADCDHSHRPRTPTSCQISPETSKQESSSDHGADLQAIESTSQGNCVPIQSTSGSSTSARQSLEGEGQDDEDQDGEHQLRDPRGGPDYRMHKIQEYVLLTPIDYQRRKIREYERLMESRRNSFSTTPSRTNSISNLDPYRHHQDTRISSHFYDSASDGNCSDTPPSPAPPPPPSFVDKFYSTEARQPDTQFLDRLNGLAPRLKDIEKGLSNVKAAAAVTPIIESDPLPASFDADTTFEEKISKIMQNPQNKSTDTLKITCIGQHKERILNAKNSNVLESSVSGSIFSPSATNIYSRSATSSRPALSIAIPQQGTMTPQNMSNHPSSSRLESPSMKRSYYGTPSSAPVVATTPISARLQAPPATAQNVQYPPDFSHPPPSIYNSNHYSMNSESQSSPLSILSAPPQPPLLPNTAHYHSVTSNYRRDSVSNMRSPPITPNSTHSSKPSVMPSTSRDRPFTTLQQKEIPVHALHTGKAPLPKLVPVRQEKLFPQRHESTSSLKSPVPGGQSALALHGRSASMSEHKTSAPTQKDADVYSSMFSKSAESAASCKIKFAKKSSANTSMPDNQSDHREKPKKEHKKDKEHKPRRKEDGTFETKEERTKRKELEKAAKHGHKHSKEHKKDKEERRKLKETTKEKSSKEEERSRKEKKAKKAEKERSKEKERIKKMKKSKKRSESDSDESDSEDESLKLARKLQELEDGVVSGQSMYDRVKRRSSAVNKNESAKQAFEQIREKNNEKKGNITKRICISSDESEDDNDVIPSEDTTSRARVNSTTIADMSDEGEERLPPKKKRKSKRDRSSSCDSGSVDDISSKQGRKKIKKDKKQQLIDLDDVFGVMSSDEDEGLKPKEPKTKKKKSISEDSASERPKKRSKIPNEDHAEKNSKKKKNGEEKEKTKEKEARKRGRTDSESKAAKKRKHRESDSASETEMMVQNNKAQTGFVEMSQDAKEEDKPATSGQELCSFFNKSQDIFNQDLVKEELDEEKDVIPQSHDNPAPYHQHEKNSDERPRLMTKAAVKAFNSSTDPDQPSTSQNDVDSDNSSGYSDSDEPSKLNPNMKRPVESNMAMSSDCSESDDSLEISNRERCSSDVELVDAADECISHSEVEPTLPPPPPPPPLLSIPSSEQNRKENDMPTDAPQQTILKEGEAQNSEAFVERGILLEEDKPCSLELTSEPAAIDSNLAELTSSNMEDESMQSASEGGYEQVDSCIEEVVDNEETQNALRGIADDDQEADIAVQSIFDDEDEDSPTYPSHDFLRKDDEAVEEIASSPTFSSFTQARSTPSLVSTSATDADLMKCDGLRKNPTPQPQEIATIVSNNALNGEATSCSKNSSMKSEKEVDEQAKSIFSESTACTDSLLPHERKPAPEATMDLSTKTPSSFSSDPFSEQDYPDRPKAFVPPPDTPILIPSTVGSSGSSVSIPAMTFSPSMTASAAIVTTPLVNTSVPVISAPLASVSSVIQSPLTTSHNDRSIVSSLPQVSPATLLPAAVMGGGLTHGMPLNIPNAHHSMHQQKETSIGMIGIAPTSSTRNQQQRTSGATPSLAPTQNTISQRDQMMEQLMRHNQTIQPDNALMQQIYEQAIRHQHQQQQHQQQHLRIQQEEQRILQESKERREREQKEREQKERELKEREQREREHRERQQQAALQLQINPSTVLQQQQLAMFLQHQQQQAFLQEQQRIFMLSGHSPRIAAVQQPQVPIVLNQQIPAAANIVLDAAQAQQQQEEICRFRQLFVIRYPSLWSGMLAMRAIECAVNMHLVTGSLPLAKRCFSAMANSDILAEIRILQRMRTDGAEVHSIVAEKMKGENSVFICIPVGTDVEDTFKNNEIIKTAFVDYFHKKESAGVATINLTKDETFTVHVFPPSDIAKRYVDLVSPDLYEKLRACANFLFIILTTSLSKGDQNSSTIVETSNATPVPTLSA